MTTNIEYDSMGIVWRRIGTMSRASAGAYHATASLRGFIIVKDTPQGREVIAKSGKAFKSGNSARTACAIALHDIIKGGKA